MHTAQRYNHRHSYWAVHNREQDAQDTQQFCSEKSLGTQDTWTLYLILYLFPVHTHMENK